MFCTVDAPCGAMAWMPKLLETIESLPDIFPEFHYTGIDVVPSVISNIKIEFQDKPWSFHNLDMTSWKSWESSLAVAGQYIIYTDTI